MSKNPEKLFFEGKRLEKLATYPTLDGRKVSDPLLYKQSQDMILMAMEEMGRENKRELKKNPEYREYIKNRVRS